MQNFSVQKTTSHKLQSKRFKIKFFWISVSRSTRQRWPTYLIWQRILRPTQGTFDTQALQICNPFYRSTQPLLLSALAVITYECGNSPSQGSFWVQSKRSWSPHRTLSCGQRSICWQRFSRPRKGFWKISIIMWSKRTLAKWSRGKGNSGYQGNSANHASPCDR